MQFSLRPEGLLERIALWFNLGPLPIAYVLFGMMSSRGVMAGVRLGLFGELAQGPRTAEALAEKLKLDPVGTAKLLEMLEGFGMVRRRGGAYALGRHARPWLDPRSPRYVGGFVEFNYPQWEWWSRLEEVVRSGKTEEIHAYPPEDPRWRQYIVAMYELARLAAPEVARAVPLPKAPKRLLDLAGAHGWFAAELCLRHEGLTATVLDLPGSARVGRELIAQAGMADWVKHVEGDLVKDALGGPYDGALMFQIIHHFSAEQNVTLLKKVAGSLEPGGTVAILDYFTDKSRRSSAAASALGLHYYLTSSAATYRLEEVRAWLEQAGFTGMKVTPIRRLPPQQLVTAGKRR